MTKKEIQTRAFNKAVTGLSLTNYPAIINGFMEKGIPEDQILPRQNVFTYPAWQALGRYVKKGSHGVRILTFIESEKEVETETGEKKVEHSNRPWTSTVFHVSQTEAI